MAYMCHEGNMEEININHNILKWCREQSGFTPEYVVEAANISPIKATKNKEEISSVERLRELEQGTRKPTLTQLKAFAKIYQRPIMTFFLNAPPKVENKLVDFRTIDSLPHEKDSPEFARLKRRLINLQEELSALERESGSAPLDFIGLAKGNENIEEFVSFIRKKLDFSFAQQLHAKDDEDLFKILRDKIQDIGVYVVLEGNLGSYHSNISTEEFRGIAITDIFAPLIAINSNDYKQAMLFTLLHEFAHILLGDSSVSNVSVNTMRVDAKEVFCNKFAAEFLLPACEVLRKTASSFNVDDIFDTVSNYAKQFKVSIMVMARRLYDLGKINNDIYTEIVSSIKRQIAKKKERQREKENAGVVSRNILDKYRLGTKVIATVLGATYSGRMSVVDASVLLNVNSSRLDRILP